MKSGVCIVECIDDNDPGSEGRLLREVLLLMSVEVELVRVKRVQELFQAIAASEMAYLHIATHGSISDTDGFRGWWTSQNVGTKRLMHALEPKARCQAIVSTACKSGSAGFAKYIVNTMGVKYYIAPSGKPQWHNAALFAHVYYHKLFKTRGTVEKAFNSYDENYKNPHGFKLFKRTVS